VPSQLKLPRWQKQSQPDDDKQKLKLWLMCIKENATIPNSAEKFVGILGYSHETALTAAKNTYILGTQGLVISHQDFILIEDLLKNINCEGVIIMQQAPAQIETPKDEKTTKEQFIARLKLASEEMVENKTDKQELLRILETIK